MINVASVSNYGGACPFQLDGITDDGLAVYVKYRAGNLRIIVDDEIVFSEKIGENATEESLRADMARFNYSEEKIQERLKSYEILREVNNGYLCFDGYLTVAELVEATKDSITWPAEFTNG